MLTQPYWNPRHETLPREALDALQAHRLRRMVAWCETHVPWYKARFAEAGVVSTDIKSLDDLARIPLFTRAEWMAQQAATPPFGPLLAAPPERAIRYHTTSGTSGATPLRVVDSATDWEWISEAWCYGFWGFGVRPRDRVMLAFSYGTFIGFWGAHYACEKIGCLVIPGGNMTTDARVRQIFDLEVTAVCSTPTYALRMAQEAERLGLDLAGGPVERLIVSGEPAGSIPATKRLLSEQWGAAVGDTAGMTELGTIVLFECEKQPGGTHLIEDHFIEEVVDPEGDAPLGYGELGERVVTSFGRHLMPVIRYRTGDLVIKQPGNCSCGRAWDLYEGGIRGRVDDMKVVRGTNVYPRAIENIVRNRREIGEFQVRLYTADEILDQIEVRVEFVTGSANREPILAALRRELSEAHEGLRIDVIEVAPETLPRFELKAQRVLDERIVIGDPKVLRSSLS